MPIQRGGLQAQEEEEQSRFLCALKPHTLTVAAVCGPVPSADQLLKPVEVHTEGKEVERMPPAQCGPFRVTVPNCSQTCRKFPHDLSGSVLLFSYV